MCQRQWRLGETGGGRYRLPGPPSVETKMGYPQKIVEAYTSTPRDVTREYDRGVIGGPAAAVRTNSLISGGTKASPEAGLYRSGLEMCILHGFADGIQGEAFLSSKSEIVTGLIQRRSFNRVPLQQWQRLLSLPCTDHRTVAQPLPTSRPSFSWPHWIKHRETLGPEPSGPSPEPCSWSARSRRLDTRPSRRSCTGQTRSVARPGARRTLKWSAMRMVTQQGGLQNGFVVAVCAAVVDRNLDVARRKQRRWISLDPGLDAQTPSIHILPHRF